MIKKNFFGTCSQMLRRVKCFLIVVGREVFSIEEK